MGSSFNDPEQVWLQPYPKGTLQRLTNDLDGYKSLSLTSDGKLLAAVQAQNAFAIFVAPASKPDGGKAIRTGKSDGLGLVWMPDETLLSQSVNSEFSSLTPDGKQRVALFKAEVYQGDFSVCRNGHLVFGRDVQDSSSIWYLEDMRQNPKQLTQGPHDDLPDCSPDGQSVIFRSSYQLKRVSLKGGSAVALGEGRNIYAVRYSPDGREIAALDEKKNWLVILSAETGRPTTTFDLPAGFGIPFNSSGWLLRWTPDSRNLTYALWKGPGAPANLWSQSLSGGAPRQITHFPDQIVAYDWSPDGKQIAYTRWSESRDVVLIRNFH
jgi:Tol biopolymer transport system component